MTKVKMLQVVLVLSVVAFSYGLVDNKKGMVEEAAKEIAIVELFTSEGCSSCPPADNLLSKIAAENKNVYVLSYHVDYWDHLGWKDPFSQSLFSERQRQYAKRFNLESIYTPQVVVNGAEEFVGSDEKRLRSSLLRSGSLPSIKLDAARKSAGKIHLSYQLKSTEALNLCVALVQPKAVNEIKRGENSGRTLHHVNVVRQLSSLDAKSASTSFDINIPASLHDEEFELLLFTQNEKDKRITAATKVAIPR